MKKNKIGCLLVKLASFMGSITVSRVLLIPLMMCL